MLLAVLIAAVTFAGCGAKEQTGEASAAAETPEVTETPEETETPEPTETPTPEVKKEKVVMYTLAKVPLRKEESKDSEILQRLAVNTKVKVLEEKDQFCYVKVDGKKGYVLSKKLTKDKEEAKQAEETIKAEKAARKAAQEEAAEKAAQEKAAAEAAAAEEAARAAEEAAQQEAAASISDSGSFEEDASISEGESGSSREVVREERFDDCDGSGHGYKIIYYSDGTEETVEY